MLRMTIDQLNEATSLLEQHGGYGWLLRGPDVLLASDIAEHLAQMGIKVTRETVGRWIKVLPHTQDFGKVGLAATRDDLILMFADRFVRRASNG
jgi:hypothetical protein